MQANFNSVGTVSPPISLEHLFDLADFKPNPNQYEAIQSVNGPLFLVAGPGSGKTRVLLWRTVNLLVFHGVHPGEVFLSTFTQKAAHQLKDGLLSLLGLVTNQTGVPYDLSGMYVGTVHSLCQRLLRDRTLSQGRARRDAVRILDALDQYFFLYSNGFWREAKASLGYAPDSDELLGDINDVFSGKPYPSKHRATQNLASMLNRFSEENLKPSTVLADASDEDVRLFGRLYACYLERLDGRVDLSLLQQAAFEMLRENNISGAFKHVIVDEYQDTNSIQETLYFKLAEDSRNLCVVGDDDQALYRFRGATVENFVQFPERCERHITTQPRRIELNTNYRSRAEIVTFYTRFMEQYNWQKPSGGYYRLHDKGIRAHSDDARAAVVASSQLGGDETADEIAALVKRLVDEGKVSDPNQVAFLFPSLKAVAAKRMQRALEQQGLKVYAPRAKRFLEADEPSDVIGLLTLLFGRPSREQLYNRGDYKDYHDWLSSCEARAKRICAGDANLKRYLEDRGAEVAQILSDHRALSEVMAARGWQRADVYEPEKHKRALASAKGLSGQAKRGLGGKYLDDIVRERREQYARGERKDPPFTLAYILNRATSTDWNLLDLFYRFCGFDHFKTMFDLAEAGEDEGPICNLSLTSQYLARFIDQYQSVVTASFIQDNMLTNLFFGSFLFALFRIGEGEFEDAEDPFPKGRIPFLTIHQSKGLEFPAVVLGSVDRRNLNPQKPEELIRPLLEGDPEPLEHVGNFDAMRQFYVALSRAKNLLVIADPRGRGIQTYAPFKPLLNGNIRRIPDLKLSEVPEASVDVEDTSRTYSYTGDFLAYLRCPRRYMLFNKYDFAASRTQTMFFGNLVHNTIEDLHNFLIAGKEGA